jgi:hypothetical protein
VTDEQRALLKSSIDMVVTLETVAGERFLAQVLFVFDEEDTPDVFFLKVDEGADGRFVQQQGSGYSMLLSEISGVYRVE